MSLTKQEKLGTGNFIVTVLAIISMKYLSLFIPEFPNIEDVGGLLIFSIVMIVAILIIHAATWVLLLRYFNIEKIKSKLIIYEILFLLSLAVLYAEAKYGILPAAIAENLLTGIGIFLIIQMLISIIFTILISKIPSK
jgi:hypothetical protein